MIYSMLVLFWRELVVSDCVLALRGPRGERCLSHNSFVLLSSSPLCLLCSFVSCVSGVKPSLCGSKKEKERMFVSVVFIF